MNQSLRKRKPPAGLWPEMDEIGEPVFEEEPSEVWGEGFSWEIAEPEQQPGRLITTLWLPTPDGTHTPYDVYSTPAAELPAPARWPLGFRKATK